MANTRRDAAVIARLVFCMCGMLKELLSPQEREAAHDEETNDGNEGHDDLTASTESEFVD